ncbi:hypothetical protein [Desulfovibrio ferrophilus]|uniref:Uncharacterized protein n=1 Tax=Desulfovibrio ferrophilus TaxID=241368 RepID=A0A2Z6AYY6_9BACT|nr:hypothetical protein [Desulfovibrio ferrophilus]BBD08481.1 uncharacterized protein DFE_1755 [Desulfovibrio ferrophilus]
MENIKHVGMIVHRFEDLWQCTRSALGLAVGNYFSYMFLLDVPAEMNEKLQENFEWLVEDMECECYSNVRFKEEHLIKYLTTDAIAKKLKEMDIVIPFGNRMEAPVGRMPILWMLDN